MRYVIGTLALLLSVTACKETTTGPKGIDPCSSHFINQISEACEALAIGNPGAAPEALSSGA